MKHEEFYLGVGVSYLMGKYGGDFHHALSEYLKEKQRLEEIERARVVDVFGDEVSEDGDAMNKTNVYKWKEESFGERVKKELAMPAWERPSMLRDFVHRIAW